MTSKISRRDFVNGALVGSGAGLLSSRAPRSRTDRSTLARRGALQAIDLMSS
jgi:hypothetical protein